MFHHSQTFPVSQASAYENLYFAYGSNMHLQQMATRCHDSIMFGKGVLRGYKWQLNSRGGANVILGKDQDFVEGIVFGVSTDDIRALRICESAASFVEQEASIEVKNFRSPVFTGQKTTAVVQVLAQHDRRVESSPSELWTDSEDQDLNHPLKLQRLETSGSSQAMPYEDTNFGEIPVGGSMTCRALIYVIQEVQTPAKIRDEYAARMKLAIADARMLGVSDMYLETNLFPNVCL